MEFYKNQRKYNKKIYSDENELRDDLYKYPTEKPPAPEKRSKKIFDFCLD